MSEEQEVETVAKCALCKCKEFKKVGLGAYVYKIILDDFDDFKRKEKVKNDDIEDGWMVVFEFGEPEIDYEINEDDGEFICPVCAETFDNREEAEECCSVEEQFECPVCNSLYDTSKEAKECCEDEVH